MFPEAYFPSAYWNPSYFIKEGGEIATGGIVCATVSLVPNTTAQVTIPPSVNADTIDFDNC